MDCTREGDPGLGNSSQQTHVRSLTAVLSQEEQGPWEEKQEGQVMNSTQDPEFRAAAEDHVPKSNQ